MPRVIKPENVVKSDNVAIIPDTVPIAPKEEALKPANEVLKELPLSDISPEERDTDLPQLEETGPSPVSGEEEAQKILSAANAQRDQIIEEANIEAAQIRIKAKEEGYESGRREAMAEIETAVRGVHDLLDQMESEQGEYLGKYAKELKYLALDIAGKVIHQKIREDDEMLLELVKDAISTIKTNDWITVEVSDKLVKLVQRLNEEYTAETGKKIEVKTKNTPEDTIQIKSPDGLLDVSPAAQLETLGQMFDRTLEE